VPFFDKTAFTGGQRVQLDIALAIANSPFFNVITSHEMKGAKYPEAEIEAAMAFSSEEKKIIPIFYGMSTDDCNGCDLELYRKLSGIAGFVALREDDLHFYKKLITAVAENKPDGPEKAAIIAQSRVEIWHWRWFSSTTL
jgi:hypothetical protein